MIVTNPRFSSHHKITLSTQDKTGTINAFSNIQTALGQDMSYGYVQDPDTQTETPLQAGDRVFLLASAYATSDGERVGSLKELHIVCPDRLDTAVKNTADFVLKNVQKVTPTFETVASCEGKPQVDKRIKALRNQAERGSDYAIAGSINTLVRNGKVFSSHGRTFYYNA